MSPNDLHAPFPVDWNEWRRAWLAWKAHHATALRPTSYQFVGKNFLADDVLGVWSINGRPVELSEVTFPDLGNQRGGIVRYVGISIGASGGTDTVDSPLVSSFAELETQLGIGVS